MFVDFLEDVEVLGLGVSDVDDDFFQVFVVYYCVVKEFSEFAVFLIRNFLPMCRRELGYDKVNCQNNFKLCWRNNFSQRFFHFFSLFLHRGKAILFVISTFAYNYRSCFFAKDLKIILFY